MMQKDWANDGMPRGSGQVRRRQKRRLGWEPAPVRPAGHVRWVVAGALVESLPSFVRRVASGSGDERPHDSDHGSVTTTGQDPPGEGKQATNLGASDHPPNGTRRTNKSGLPTGLAGRTRAGPNRGASFRVRRDFEHLVAWPLNHFYLLFPDPKPHLQFLVFCQGTLSRLDKTPKTVNPQSGIGEKQGVAKPKRATQNSEQAKTPPPERQTPALTLGASALFNPMPVKPRMGGPSEICG
jgi:hypothetical protein